MFDIVPSQRFYQTLMVWSFGASESGLLSICRASDGARLSALCSPDEIVSTGCQLTLPGQSSEKQTSDADGI